MPPQPDSSRRASAVSGSRGLPLGALNAAGSLSLRVTESPAASPRVTRSVKSRKHILGCHDDVAIARC